MMTATTAVNWSTITSDSAHAAPQGVERAIMHVGLALLNWATMRTEYKAAIRVELTDHERFQLQREATALREAAYAERAHWHTIG